MFRTTRHLLELIRFSHTVFALPFALLAGMMAWRSRALEDPQAGGRWQEWVGILLCMVLARSAAMAFNRLADRRLDAENPRTRGRHLPAGLLSPVTVAVFFIACSLGFVASTALFLPNPWPQRLSVPVLLFICGYSLAKRFTALVHFWLGLALMLAPVCAWIAIRGFDGIGPALMLGGAVLLWVAGFDIIYACQDYETDVRQGLHSVPSRLGVRGALRTAALCHAGTVILLLALPAASGLSWIFFGGAAATALLLAYEHWLVQPRDSQPIDLNRINVAFFNVNAVISIGLLIVGAIDLWMA